MLWNPHIFRFQSRRAGRLGQPVNVPVQNSELLTLLLLSAPLSDRSSFSPREWLVSRSLRNGAALPGASSPCTACIEGVWVAAHRGDSPASAIKEYQEEWPNDQSLPYMPRSQLPSENLGNGCIPVHGRKPKLTWKTSSTYLHTKIKIVNSA